MYKVGVDLGGTNIVAGVIDDDYKIISKSKLKTNVPRPAEEIFDDIATCVERAVESAGLDLREIQSIGIGTPGSVDKVDGVIQFANNLYFENVHIVEYLDKKFPTITIRIENDANCAALGEAIAGAGKGRSSFIAVTLGTGVGGGYILNGRLVTGCNGAGGEFGHTVIKFDGIDCNCGRRGCWECYASATALVNQTKEAMLANKNSLMWKKADGKIENVNGRTAFDAMRDGDEAAKKVVDTYIGYIAVGTINLINELQPELICFGGGISNEKENLLAPLRKSIDKFRYSRYADTQTEICSAVLGNDAGIIGAALVEY